MGGKRFPRGSPLAVGGAALAIAGVSLKWLALRIDADQGTAVFSLSGWNFTLGWAAGITAAVGGLVALLAMLPGMRMGRAGGVLVLLFGVGVIAVGGVQIGSKPSVEKMNSKIGDAFSKTQLATYDQQLSGWTGIKTGVDAKLGLWLAIAGGALLALGGALTASLGPAKVAAPAQPAWPGAQPMPAPPYQGQPPVMQPAPGLQPYPAPQQVAYAPISPAPQPAPPPVAARVPAPAAPPPVAPTAAPQTPPATPATKFCATCGSLFADDATRFCATCGTPRLGAG